MNAEKYKTEFGILSAASAGVVLTRTREPHRVLIALHEFACAKTRTFRHWNFRDGWITPQADPSLPPTIEALNEPYGALRRIMDLDGDGQQAWDQTVMAMVWPEVVIGQHPPFEECLRQYARAFPTSHRRLVIITDEGFVLPPKLQHDIPVLDFDLPSRDELREVYLSLAESLSGDTSEIEQPLSESELTALTALGSGMTESEFELACAKAIALKKSSWPNVSFDHFARILSESKTDIIRRSEVLELMQAGSPNDIGGLEPLKDWVQRRKPVFTQDARDWGVDAPRGIVMIGPPGTGKSASAKAIAGTLGLPLIKLDIGKCFGSLVGQTESRVRAALKQVEAMAPCVVFLDEVDKAGIDPRQGGGDSGTSQRVMGSLLTFMQESTAPMFWVLTANRHHSLDPALLRKGRMDEVFSVLPPNREERKQIVSIHLKKRKQPMLKGKDLDQVLDASKGYVGAEIEAAIKEAVVDAYATKAKVTGADISKHLSCMKPISVAFKKDFDSMVAWAANNARPSSLPEDEPASNSAPRVIRRQGRVMD